MRFLLQVLGLAVPAAAMAAPVQESPLLVPVRQLFASFNAGRPDAAASAFAADAVIIDEFPPYRWQGPKAHHDWAADLAKATAAYGATNMHARIGAPTWAETKGSNGFLVVPEALDSRVNGKPMCERGLHSFSFRKERGQWKITVSAWALGAILPGRCKPV
ncbi:nuclear transport factor 2 family protein [Sandarakinorhabdus rubra]|uniref:nuclear transport factor 2 family protein n=1 Tax=Sandarakinorhabdus rubra TaxID=2672568 RepID=UPI0013DCD27D|nr:nuclear transport factor 2 family protein [Sandarakinorhabdus rubra]